jgi:hypothetical protein
MKRRALLIRTFVSAVSAGVFTATGWLMGTRTLTMSEENSCEGEEWECGQFVYKCVGANCPTRAGYCLYNVVKYCCPDGGVFHIGEYCGNHCCGTLNCPPDGWPC